MKHAGCGEWTCKQSTALDRFQTHIAGNMCWPVARGYDPSHVMLHDTRRRQTTDDMATGNGGVMTPGNAESDMPRNLQLGSEIGDFLAKKGETNFVLTSGAVQNYELLEVLGKADPLLVSHLDGGS